jgi:HEAT repeat protein
VPRLLELYRNGPRRVRPYAIGALANKGPFDAQVLDVLKAALNEDDPLVQMMALASVAQGASPSEAVPLLAGALGSANALLRMRAAEHLGNLGPAAKAALPEIEKAAGDPNPHVCWAALFARSKILGQEPPK